MLVKKISIILLFILLVSCAFAQTPSVYISNTERWQDVYSVMQFSKVIGGTGYFLVSARHSTLLINQISRDNSVMILSSSSNPYVVGYKSILESRGFNEVQEIRSNNINLELANRLPSSVKDFIVLDDSYGYNAISVAPYAAISKSYVIFANRRNINQVVSYLNSRNPTSVLLYGQLDREVKEAMEQFSPKIINENDRFLNNQKIIEEYQKLHKQIYGEPKKQAILTNGEFIEQEIMSGVEPVVFIGRSNVPDQVRDYVKASDIDIGILIGNELIGSATLMRRDLGISVFVKFAQSARAPTSSISPVEDLDRFYLPRYIIELDIYSIRYNRISNIIEVTYQNLVDLSAFLKGTITLRSGTSSQILGDEDSIFIDKSQFKTIIYSRNAEGQPLDPMTGDITADVFTIYGESKKSLEYTLRKTIEVETVDISDNSKIEIGQIRYDRRTGRFLIDIINTGNVDVFVDLEILDVLINDELVSFGSDQVVFIKKGATKTIEVEVPMAEEDIASNPKIRVRAYYGERERSLVNVLEGEYIYGFTGLGFTTGQILRQIGENALIFAPLVIIIILLLLILGMKKKCPNCGEINKLRSKHCHNCGAEI